MIISFSGTDGSGKSTQIKALTDEFYKHGFRVKYLWSRGGYTPLFSAVKKILRIITAKQIPDSNSPSRVRLLKKKSVSSIWLAISILDLFIFYSFARIISWFGVVVIFDRYIEDTLIDFKINFPVVFNDQSFIWKLLVLTSPKPSHSFLLFVPVNVSLLRSKIKGEPFPDSPETLSIRLKIYMDESIFPADKYYKIDCQQSIESIQIEIKKKFKELS